jgi:glycosyltransferase involved in cell wall biosynthesis
MKKIIIFTRCVSTFINFRQPLVEHLSKNKSISVSVCMDFSGHDIQFFQKKFPNIIFHNIEFLQNGKFKLLKEIVVLISIFKILRNDKNILVNNFTIKPIFYVSVLSLFFPKIKLVNTITGLGHIFFSNNFLKNLVKLIYNIIFLKTDYVIFQNNQDHKVLIYSILKKFINIKIIYPDLKFKNKSKVLRKRRKKISFLMFCRLIKEKGTIEYLKAAEIVSKKIKKNLVKFYLIGKLDKNNPSALSNREINFYRRKGVVSIRYQINNIFNIICKASVIVHPSYGEGLPASIIEAMYCSKPIITTKVNGCQELVKNSYNGVLINSKNVTELAEAMIFFINNHNKIILYGKNSKKFFNMKFKKPGKTKYLKIYNQIWKN